MDWKKLTDRSRVNRPSYQEEKNRPAYVQDADRISFSAPFRRLANKTQVHPLYDNDHIHHRLIHSVETSSVGRSLGVSVGTWLEDKNEIDAGERQAISGIVQAACLAHDIGNPPFGHSGEEAIGDWFDEKFKSREGILADISSPLQKEFTEFEGNAQGFRLLTRLEMYRDNGGMQLSKSVLGTFVKYPLTAYAKDAIKSSPLKSTKDYSGFKKFGVFDSELKIFEGIAESIGLPKEKTILESAWKRHPLVFLVEAADDICYNILDLEDAYTSGEIPYEEAINHLSKIAAKDIIKDAYMTKEEHVSYARARAIGEAIKECTKAFKHNYQSIMNGCFSQDLVSASEKKEAFFKIKNLSKERIFTSARKTELEVLGRNTIHTTLDGLFPLYRELSEKNWDEKELSNYNRQLKRAINLDLRGVNDAYTALHSLADFISGMTDRYSIKFSRMLAKN